MHLDPPSTADQLLALLRRGERLTQQEAADRLDLSARQVRRIITRFQEENIPIRSARRGRAKEYYLDLPDQQVDGLPVGLKERQMLALVVAAEAARSALRPTPLADPLAGAVGQLLPHISPHVMSFEPEEESGHWHFGDAPSVDLDPDVFETLTAAIDRRQPVRIDYYTASTDTHWDGRKINPLVLAAPRGSWICVAYCHMREGLRDFSLAGIDRVAPCTSGGQPERFDRPEGFDPEFYFRDRFGALAGDEVHTVRLLVEPDRAPYFERKRYHPTQVIEEGPEEREDNRMVVSYEVAGLQEVRAWVRSWGPGVKVLDPPELASLVAEDAAATREQYE